MRLSDFDYDLPESFIAQTPVEPRDSSRLMLLDRRTGAIEHRVFRDILDLIDPGDVLVLNYTRVIPARLHATKADTGGGVEVLLLRQMDETRWQALVGGRRVLAGTKLVFGDTGITAEITDVLQESERIVRFNQPINDWLETLGEMPLPPYIHTRLADPERYQTVYSRVVGSAAAPTAGLHFTPALIERLDTLGIGMAFVTLHVGLDTFRPVEVEDARSHVMHSEWAELPGETAAAINAARAAGGRVVAVGTTAVRVLESAALASAGVDPGQPQDFAALPAPTAPPLAPYSGWTRLFITPGYQYRAVDALITNFHLPRSTLLMLVSAFAGRAAMLAAYEAAVAAGYRFFSFGDAMLIV